VGKSRLFNALVGQEHAIVSAQPGTTRDYLVAVCHCDGHAIELVDTAGIESPRNPIEAQAQSLRDDQADRADLLLVCSSADTRTASVERATWDVPELQVWTKCDLVLPCPSEYTGAIRTSATTGEGLATLRDAIATSLLDRITEGDLPASTCARCRDSLLGGGSALRSAAGTLGTGGGDELVAVDLRRAIDELGKVVGEVVNDDILDRIFQRFCIGK
jgi:tRNA modification GTPase